jgi:hypothetical protein
MWPVSKFSLTHRLVHMPTTIPSMLWMNWVESKYRYDDLSGIVVFCLLKELEAKFVRIFRAFDRLKRK